MSRFGIRRRLKGELKKILGMEEAFTESHPQEVVPPVPERPVENEEVVAAAPEPPPAEEPAVAAEPLEAEENQPTADTALQPEENGEDIVGLPLTMEAVQEILDDMVRPALQGDGGDISLIKIEEDNIYVQLVGACSTCPSSVMTMKMGVEALLKEEFPTMNDLIEVDSQA